MSDAVTNIYFFSNRIIHTRPKPRSTFSGKLEDLPNTITVAALCMSPRHLLSHQCHQAVLTPDHEGCNLALTRTHSSEAPFIRPKYDALFAHLLFCPTVLISVPRESYFRPTEPLCPTEMISLFYSLSLHSSNVLSIALVIGPRWHQDPRNHVAGPWPPSPT